MKMLQFSYDAACVPEHELTAITTSVFPEIERMRKCYETRSYADAYSFLNVPSDKKMLDHISAVVAEKRALNPALLIVVGIGGSNLGTQAIAQAILGILYNESMPETKIYYADTVDTDYILDLVVIMEQALQQERTVLINIVSKSGTTLETVANAQIFLDLLRHYYNDSYHHYVVVTTDKDSALWKIAYTNKYALLEIPAPIGGRYSVLTSVGLFPLGLLAIDIDQLYQGAHDATQNCLEKSLNNNALVSAAILFYHYSQGFNIHDTFLFSVDFEALGKWYRQLMAESLGKELDKYGNRVEVGMTPTVSLGTTDLHSVGQLYLAGPRDKITTFISVAEKKSECQVPLDGSLNILPAIKGKTLDVLMKAIYQGVTQAYRFNKRPYIAVELPEASAYYLGQLLQTKMCEIVYLGFLLEVNPFDQPNVELYKQNTREILGT